MVGKRLSKRNVVRWHEARRRCDTKGYSYAPLLLLLSLFLILLLLLLLCVILVIVMRNFGSIYLHSHCMGIWDRVLRLIKTKPCHSLSHKVFFFFFFCFIIDVKACQVFKFGIQKFSNFPNTQNKNFKVWKAGVKKLSQDPQETLKIDGGCQKSWLRPTINLKDSKWVFLTPFEHLHSHNALEPYRAGFEPFFSTPAVYNIWSQGESGLVSSAFALFVQCFVG